MAHTRDKIDRDLLHEWLWKKSDHLNRISMSVTEIAAACGVTIYTMSHIFQEMRAAGRLRKTGRTYYVVDPRIWVWVDPSPSPPAKVKRVGWRAKRTSL